MCLFLPSVALVQCVGKPLPQFLCHRFQAANPLREGRDLGRVVRHDTGRGVGFRGRLPWRGERGSARKLGRIDQVSPRFHSGSRSMPRDGWRGVSRDASPKLSIDNVISRRRGDRAVRRVTIPATVAEKVLTIKSQRGV